MQSTKFKYPNTSFTFSLDFKKKKSKIIYYRYKRGAFSDKNLGKIAKNALIRTLREQQTEAATPQAPEPPIELSGPPVRRGTWDRLISESNDSDSDEGLCNYNYFYTRC